MNARNLTPSRAGRGTGSLEAYSAAFADSDFSDDDLDFEGLGSDDDDLDSAAGFESVVGFEAESLEDAVVPLVAGFSVVEVESESVLGVLFLA
jgi:hypothetical protein